MSDICCTGYTNKVKLGEKKNSGWSITKTKFEISFPSVGQVVNAGIDYILQYHEEISFKDQKIIKDLLQSASRNKVCSNSKAGFTDNISVRLPKIEERKGKT